MKKVVLIGYMGSGKSVIAKKMADKIGIPVAELDEIIEKECEMPIEKIFATKGELFFRKKEHEIFLRILNGDTNVILSTGGGTPCYFNNHEFLHSEGVVSIYLKASVDTLFDRLVIEKNKRPLLANLPNDEMKEFIAKHLFDRSFYYNQATIKVAVDGKTIEEITAEIVKKLA